MIDLKIAFAVIWIFTTWKTLILRRLSPKPHLFVVLFLGCFGFVVGVVGIVAFFVKVSMLGFHMPDATLQGGTILWFGFGVSWMISGWCLRTGRWGLGVLGMVLGILVPFLILGMLYSP